MQIHIYILVESWIKSLLCTFHEKLQNISSLHLGSTVAEETTQRIVENTTTQSNFTTPVSTPYVVTTNAKIIARTTLTKTAATTSAATISTNSATASTTTPAKTTAETNTTTTNGMKYEPTPNSKVVFG